MSDAGGLYEAVFLLGYVLNYFATWDTLSIQMLTKHFLVEPSSDTRSSRLGWLKNRKKQPLSCLERLFYAKYCFRLLFQVCEWRRGGNRRKSRRKLLIQARNETTRALDLRTLLSLQSVVQALARVTFDPK